MKKIGLLFLAFFAFMGIQAQTVDQIVSRHIEAMGGKEKLASLKTVKMSGSMSVQGTDITLTITKSHMIGMRMDLEVMSTSNYQLANTKTGWVYMPVMGMTEPKEMDAEQYKAVGNQLDIQGSLVNYKEKGTTVELVDSQKVDGAYAYNLKLTFSNGKVVNQFYDSKTGRLVKSVTKQDMQGQEMEMETMFADYKQNADGYWFPHSITSMQGTMAIDKIETNITVDEKIYTN
jgi:hypothetical protein